MAFVAGGAFAFAAFFLPVYLQGLGFNGLEIGFLVGLTSIAAIFAAFPAGLLNDLFSARAVLVFALILGVVFFLAVAFSSVFWLMALLFLAFGVSRMAFFTTLETILLKAKQPGAEGKKFGVFGLWRYVGCGLGVVIGGAALFALDFRLTFAGIAVLLAALLLPAFYTGKKIKADFQLSDYGKGFTLKTALFALVLFLFSLHWGAETTSYALYLKGGLGLNAVLSGVYMGIPIVILGVATFYAGKRIDKNLSFKTLFLLGILLSGAGQVLMVNPDVGVSFFWRVIHEIGDGLFVLTEFIWISLLFESRKMGGSYGVLTTIMMLGSFAGALIFGPMGQELGYGTPLVVSGLIVFAEGILLAVYLSRKKLKVRRSFPFFGAGP
ncbi:MAG: MFS transporter, partial [Candidatus Micrarchaeota archaeon]